MAELKFPRAGCRDASFAALAHSSWNATRVAEGSAVRRIKRRIVTQLCDGCRILSAMEARIPGHATTPRVEPGTISLPLRKEELVVTHRVVAGDTVRVSVVTEAHEQLVDEALANIDVAVEHVPIGRYVDEMPAVRQEGELTILPVVEEVLVLQRRLLLREEIHVRRVASTTRHVEKIMLRTQHPTVTRQPSAASGAPGMADREAGAPAPSPLTSEGLQDE